MRHCLSLLDFTSTEIETILELGSQIKKETLQGERRPRLERHVLGLLFSKPSLRTRVSFESGMAQLGGSSLYLGGDVGWGKRETTADFARVLSQYIDILVCRTHAHSNVEELAKYSDCIVINGLTDMYHPCQALADVMTIRELKGDLKNCKLTYVGDGNNVSRSLAIACGKVGMTFSIACPKAYHLDQPFLEQLEAICPGFAVQQTDDIESALENASAVYTDVWSSMGYEAETAQREKDFADFQVNSKLMSLAPSDAVFMHCLPAHRGAEVTDEVMDSPQSVVVVQAANRMHAQKGLMVWLSQQK